MKGKHNQEGAQLLALYGLNTEITYLIIIISSAQRQKDASLLSFRTIK